MHRLIWAALLLALFGVVHGSHNQLVRSHFRNIRDLHRNKIIAKRQLSNCTYPENYASSCLPGLTNLVDAFNGSGSIQNALEDFCTSGCVQPLVDYYNCKGEFATAAYWSNVVCAQNGNQYCLAFLDEFLGPESFQTGFLDDFCAPECVQPLVDYFNHVGEFATGAFWSNVICAKNGNQYCISILDELTGSESIQIATLEDFCAPECVQSFVDYYSRVEGDLLTVTYFNSLICGQNGNQYCLIILDEDNTIEGNIECVREGEICSPSCADMQESVVDEWGCCAASYYAYMNATCEVGAGDVCDGMGDDGVGDEGIVNRVGLGLIAIFAMVAAFTNPVLF